MLVIGAGGVGSPCALYLAAAGVGTIGIADGDRVELSNLQRQLLYTTAELGRPKAEAAAAALCAMGLCGELAHQRLGRLDGNAAYRNLILDAMYQLTPAQLEEGANYEVR